MSERVLIVELGLDASNDDLRDQMRILKRARENKFYENIVCVIRGFDSDERELYEIPEIRAFCRRVVTIGLISYLDMATIYPIDIPRLAKSGWGASEVWLCGEGRRQPNIPLSENLIAELENAISEANTRADAVCGPMS